MRSKLDVLGYKAPAKSESWVHHGKVDSLEKLSPAQLEQYYELLDKIFPNDPEGGELEGDHENAVVVREISEFKGEGS
jgi:hypothetical protein